jgi:hypothetical protein
MSISPPERPPRLALELEGRHLEFVRVDGDLYAAEVDGKRLPIRVRRETASVSESAASHPGDATDIVGESCSLDELLRCIELGAKVSQVPGGELLFEATDNWGHFRQNTYLWVRVVLKDGERVLLDVSVGEQDESYY